MSKQVKCWECWGVRGQSRGYGAVGPHPDAPPREALPVQTGPLEMCCGGTCVRELCFIHANEPRPTERAPVYEVEDLAPGATTIRVDVSGPTVFTVEDAVRREPTACGQYMRTYRGGRLVDEEPIDCYVGASGYAEVAAPAFTVEALPTTAEQRAAFCLPIRITLTGALSQVCVRGKVSV